MAHVANPRIGAVLVTVVTAKYSSRLLKCPPYRRHGGLEQRVSGTQDESGSGKRRSVSISFIEQFLRQGQQGRLAALLVGKLDAFNRIATTFGRERCEEFCSNYTEKLRDILRARRDKFIALVDASPPPSLTLNRLAPVAQRLGEPTK